MASVTELGYLGLNITDVTAWKRFAVDIIGMEWRDDGEKDRFYLRMDDWHHRITLHANGRDDLAYLGWRVAGPDELEEIKEQLRQLEVPFQPGSERDCEERHVLGMIKLRDPSANPLEIFHGPHVEPSMPFYPGRRMRGRFATGAGGLGHVSVRTDDPEISQRFYTRALGMRGTIEYKMTVPGLGPMVLYFLHCNQRDHSLALAANLKQSISHLMVESTDIDDVGMTHEIAQRDKVPIAVALGKHSNDRMLSFYMMNPSGWMTEYGSGGRDASYQTEYYSADVWGHQHLHEIGAGANIEERKN